MMINWLNRRKPDAAPPAPTLEDLEARSHDDLGSMDMGGTTVPVIILDDERFNRAVAPNIRATEGRRAMAINTDLNIMQDGLGHVFVDVSAHLAGGRESVLIDARLHLEFFKQMAKSTMLAFGSKGSSRIFAIQLPRPQSVHDALDMIERGLLQ